MYLIDFCKNLFKKKNIGTIVYLFLNTVIYIALFGGFSKFSNFVLAVVLYIGSLAIALSPIGEWILRVQHGCKSVRRQDYLDRLQPLFDEVYERAKVLEPNLPNDIQFYMCDDDNPNAFATGRKTVCITKGLMTYTDGQIKSILAHEFAHLAHKDTDFILLVAVGNMLLNIIFIIYRVIVQLLTLIISFATESIAGILASIFIDVILVFLMWLWTKFGMLLVMHTSRKQEFKADAFASRLGYGNHLAVALDSFSVSSTNSFWGNLESTHPDTGHRIGQLQELGATYRNPQGHSIENVNLDPEKYSYSHDTDPMLPEITNTSENHLLEE